MSTPVEIPDMTIEDLSDLDSANVTPCEMREECAHEVEYILTHTCCGAQWLACALDKQGYTDLTLRRRLSGTRVACARCKSREFSDRWRRV